VAAAVAADTAYRSAGPQTRARQSPVPQRVTAMTAGTSRAPPSTAAPISDQRVCSQRQMTVPASGHWSQPGGSG
jgi:hypothetical protein